MTSRVDHENSFLHWLQRRGWAYYFIFALAFTMHRIGMFSRSNKNGLRVGKIELQRGMTLHQNEYVASCVGFANPFCSPMYLTMQDNGQLVLYRGLGRENKSWVKSALKEEEHFAHNELVWQSGKQKMIVGIKKTVMFQDFEGAVLPDGSLAIVRGRKNRGAVVWFMSAAEVQEHPILSKALYIQSFH